MRKFLSFLYNILVVNLSDDEPSSLELILFVAVFVAVIGFLIYIF
jgi:hypothetical protein